MVVCLLASSVVVGCWLWFAVMCCLLLLMFGALVVWRCRLPSFVLGAVVIAVVCFFVVGDAACSCYGCLLARGCCLVAVICCRCNLSLLLFVGVVACSCGWRWLWFVGCCRCR